VFFWISAKGKQGFADRGLGFSERKISEPPSSSSSLLIFTLATILCQKLMKLVGNNCSHTRFK